MPVSPEPEKQAEAKPPRPTGELPLRTGRVLVTARQRGADITALGCLVLHLPHACASLAVVFGASYCVAVLGGPPWWLLWGGWVLSGTLVFHQPCERLLARRLFGLRHPTPEEDRKLRFVWREVTARAGVDAGVYQLWVEDSDDVNAMAAAGHIVGVTSHSLRLPSAQLAGVLAHELGHHTRGHAWASLLTVWYALPGRLAWRLLLALASRVDRLSVGASILVTALAGALAVALAAATYGLVLLPLATPWLAAAVARRAELRADEHAAGLGFAAELMTVLRDEHERDRAGAEGPSAEEEGLVARLLHSHPDVHTRLHHLRARAADGR
ncbi:M48 family metalloprotease [Streptomyces sp. NPDC087512]|uniref:M48 family metalloprotease n=1 Tax=Streptomyces sp. NPDC087512 TaxID=3155059 RepID=UPI003443028E